MGFALLIVSITIPVFIFEEVRMRCTDSGTMQDERDGLTLVKQLCASVSRQSALLHRSAARTV